MSARALAFGAAAFVGFPLLFVVGVRAVVAAAGVTWTEDIGGGAALFGVVGGLIAGAAAFGASWEEK